ncbi:putative tRNA nucleotidyltransferase/poly(A) polymerase [uncultured Gammaproteobacteria bacterium]
MISSCLAVQRWMTGTEVARVFAALAGTDGAEARFIGGCVRDALAGIRITDIDIATPLPPNEVTRRLKAARIKVVPTGIAHGTVTAVAGRSTFEITTLRRDLACDGRHAVVEFTDDWQADAARRDLTINALSCRPDGTLFDPFDGAADLKAGKVRFISAAAERIEEDVLRVLRFFRFHARFGRGQPDAEALTACRVAAPRLATLSGERVRAELFKLLVLESCPAVWRRMVNDGILTPLLPAATNTRCLKRLIAIERELDIPAAGRQPGRQVVRLAALLPTGQRDTALATAERLRLSNAERNHLCALVNPPVQPRWDDAPADCRRHLLRLADSDLYLKLIYLNAAADRSALPLFDQWTAAHEAVSEWDCARFPLSGRELIKMGVPHGPEIGRLLTEIKEWWVEHAYQPDQGACLRELNRRVARAVE